MRLTPEQLSTRSIRSRGFLPHWQIDDADYFITYRLADSLPQSIVAQLLEERKRLALSRSERITRVDQERIAKLFSHRVDHFLDAGHGSCLLRNPEIASVVIENLMHFNEARYDLKAWCVMPNHVHVVVQLGDGSELARVIHSWKSYTGKIIKKIAGLETKVWQEEYFDRIIRGERDLSETVEYVLNNPRAAGLRDWPWVWVKA